MSKKLRSSQIFICLSLSVLSCCSCYADSTSLGARPDLREIGERRAEAHTAASAKLAEQDKQAPDTRDYWHRRQPLRIPLSADDRAIIHAALDAELNSPEVDFDYVKQCVSLCMYDEPNPKLEQLLFNVISVYPAFPLQNARAGIDFGVVIGTLSQQGTVAVQEFMVELIAPDPKWKFKTVAQRLFEVTKAEEHVRLSSLAASWLADNASLDFAKETLEKGSVRLGGDSPYLAALKRCAEAVEQKLEGRVYLGDAVP